LIPWIESVGPVIKVLLVFSLVVVLIRASVQVGVALMVGGAFLGVLFGMNALTILKSALYGVLASRALILALIVSLILILSSSMERFGMMEELLGRLRSAIGVSRWGLVSFPAIIGLLPMPGGAVFSAPMLQGFDCDGKISPALKSYLNYWFRHVWEYWWPLYPGVLLACAVAGVDLWRFIAFSSPLTLIAIGVGTIQLMRVPRRAHAAVPAAVNAYSRPAWMSALPLLMAIFPGVASGVLLQLAGRGGILEAVPKEFGLLLGLAGAVVCSWIMGSAGLREILGIVFDKKVGRMLLTLSGVFVFKAVMERSPAAEELASSLGDMNIPVLWVSVILPMLVGAISGLTIAFVGASFPVLFSLIGATGGNPSILPILVLAYASGFAGVMATPLHLCLILSNEYFKVPLGRVYRYLAPSVGLMLVGILLYFWVLTIL
jgi:hypothetical protein